MENAMAPPEKDCPMTHNDAASATKMLQYESVMRSSHSFLQRRDLNSYDEVPLYFAWERLYSAANAKLSVDWVDESFEDFVKRRRSRVLPRRGLPPTAAELQRQRESARSSAFLRTSFAASGLADPYLRGSAKMRAVRAAKQSMVKDKKSRAKKLSKRTRAILEKIERELRSGEFGFQSPLPVKPRGASSLSGGAENYLVGDPALTKPTTSSVYPMEKAFVSQDRRGSVDKTKNGGLTGGLLDESVLSGRFASLGDDARVAAFHQTVLSTDPRVVFDDLFPIKRKSVVPAPLKKHTVRSQSVRPSEQPLASLGKKDSIQDDMHDDETFDTTQDSDDFDLRATHSQRRVSSTTVDPTPRRQASVLSQNEQHSRFDSIDSVPGGRSDGGSAWTTAHDKIESRRSSRVVAQPDRQSVTQRPPQSHRGSMVSNGQAVGIAVANGGASYNNDDVIAHVDFAGHGRRASSQVNESVSRRTAAAPDTRRQSGARVNVDSNAEPVDLNYCVDVVVEDEYAESDEAYEGDGTGHGGSNELADGSRRASQRPSQQDQRSSISTATVGRKQIVGGDHQHAGYDDEEEAVGVPSRMSISQQQRSMSATTTRKQSVHAVDRGEEVMIGDEGEMADAAQEQANDRKSSVHGSQHIQQIQLIHREEIEEHEHAISGKRSSTVSTANPRRVSDSRGGDNFQASRSTSAAGRAMKKLFHDTDSGGNGEEGRDCVPVPIRRSTGHTGGDTHGLAYEDEDQIPVVRPVRKLSGRPISLSSSHRASVSPRGYSRSRTNVLQTLDEVDGENEEEEDVGDTGEYNTRSRAASSGALRPTSSQLQERDERIERDEPQSIRDEQRSSRSVPMSREMSMSGGHGSDKAVALGGPPRIGENENYDETMAPAQFADLQLSRRESHSGRSSQQYPQVEASNEVHLQQVARQKRNVESSNVDINEANMYDRRQSSHTGSGAGRSSMRHDMRRDTATKQSGKSSDVLVDAEDRVYVEDRCGGYDGRRGNGDVQEEEMNSSSRHPSRKNRPVQHQEPIQQRSTSMARKHIVLSGRRAEADDQNLTDGDANDGDEMIDQTQEQVFYRRSSRGAHHAVEQPIRQPSIVLPSRPCPPAEESLHHEDRTLQQRRSMVSTADRRTMSEVDSFHMDQEPQTSHSASTAGQAMKKLFYEGSRTVSAERKPAVESVHIRRPTGHPHRRISAVEDEEYESDMPSPRPLRKLPGRPTDLSSGNRASVYPQSSSRLDLHALDEVDGEDDESCYEDSVQGESGEESDGIIESSKVTSQRVPRMAVSQQQTEPVKQYEEMPPEPAASSSRVHKVSTSAGRDGRDGNTAMSDDKDEIANETQRSQTFYRSSSHLAPGKRNQPASERSQRQQDGSASRKQSILMGRVEGEGPNTMASGSSRNLAQDRRRVSEATSISRRASVSLNSHRENTANELVLSDRTHMSDEHEEDADPYNANVEDINGAATIARRRGLNAVLASQDSSVSNRRDGDQVGRTSNGEAEEVIEAVTASHRGSRMGSSVEQEEQVESTRMLRRQSASASRLHGVENECEQGDACDEYEMVMSREERAQARRLSRTAYQWGYEVEHDAPSDQQPHPSQRVRDFTHDKESEERPVQQQQSSTLVWADCQTSARGDSSENRESRSSRASPNGQAMRKLFHDGNEVVSPPGHTRSRPDLSHTLNEENGELGDEKDEEIDDAQFAQDEQRPIAVSRMSVSEQMVEDRLYDTRDKCHNEEPPRQQQRAASMSRQQNLAKRRSRGSTVMYANDRLNEEELEEAYIEDESDAQTSRPASRHGGQSRRPQSNRHRQSEQLDQQPEAVETRKQSVATPPGEGVSFRAEKSSAVQNRCQSILEKTKHVRASMVSEVRRQGMITTEDRRPGGETSVGETVDATIENEHDDDDVIRDDKESIRGVHARREASRRASHMAPQEKEQLWPVSGAVGAPMTPNQRAPVDYRDGNMLEDEDAFDEDDGVRVVGEDAPDRRSTHAPSQLGKHGQHNQAARRSQTSEHTEEASFQSKRNFSGRQSNRPSNDSANASLPGYVRAGSNLHTTGKMVGEENEHEGGGDNSVGEIERSRGFSQRAAPCSSSFYEQKMEEQVERHEQEQRRWVNSESMGRQMHVHEGTRHGNATAHDEIGSDAGDEDFIVPVAQSHRKATKQRALPQRSQQGVAKTQNQSVAAMYAEGVASYAAEEICLAGVDFEDQRRSRQKRSVPGRVRTKVAGQSRLATESDEEHEYCEIEVRGDRVQPNDNASWRTTQVISQQQQTPKQRMSGRMRDSGSRRGGDIVHELSERGEMGTESDARLIKGTTSCGHDTVALNLEADVEYSSKQRKRMARSRTSVNSAGTANAVAKESFMNSDISFEKSARHASLRPSNRTDAQANMDVSRQLQRTRYCDLVVPQSQNATELFAEGVSSYARGDVTSELDRRATSGTAKTVRALSQQSAQLKQQQSMRPVMQRRASPTTSIEDHGTDDSYDEYEDAAGPQASSSRWATRTQHQREVYEEQSRRRAQNRDHLSTTVNIKRQVDDRVSQRPNQAEGSDVQQRMSMPPQPHYFHDNTRVYPVQAAAVKPAKRVMKQVNSRTNQEDTDDARVKLSSSRYSKAVRTRTGQEYVQFNVNGSSMKKDAVWPPGMEHEAKRVPSYRGKDNHPLVPPGMEHLVSEEQLVEYWTWLHWYSCWQLYYLQSSRAKKAQRHDHTSKLHKEAQGKGDNQPRRASVNWFLRLDGDSGR